jgi:FixJ family two-component response regulator
MPVAAPAEPVVFVVDDDASVRQSIHALLKSVDLECETFSSPADLITRLGPGDVGCVVMDVRMPKMSGLDAQQVLVEHGVDLPMIFVTAHNDVPMAVRAMKAGAVDVFPKPFDTHAFIATVQRAIERHRVAHKDRLAVDELRRRFETLTDRERAVMAMVASGRLNKQTAGELGTSEKTVKKHRAHVMAKMGATSLPDLVRMADRLELPERVTPLPF